MADICTEHFLTLDLTSGFHSCEGLSKNEAAPFVHRFQTDKEKYIYDVNTLRILKVSPVVWDIIEDFGLLSKDQIVEKYCPPYQPDQVEAAIQKIDHFRAAEGMLLSNRPDEILPPREEMIENKLNSHREQLILNVTENCNFRCSYCLFDDEFDGFRDHSEQVMSWETAQKAIQEFFLHSEDTEVLSIGFYGGEPLLNMKLIQQCVDYINKSYNASRVNFSITTNGSLLRDDMAKFLADENFIIIISLDGPCEIHDFHRRTKKGNPTWSNIIDNLREFLNSYPEYQSNGRLKFNAVATDITNVCDCQSFWSHTDLFSDSMGLMISAQKDGLQKENLLSQDTLLSRSLKTVYEEFINNLQTGTFFNEYGKSSMWVQAALFEQTYVMFHKRGRISPHLPAKMRFLSHCIPGVRRTFVSIGGDYYPCERVPTCKAQSIGNVETGIELTKVTALIQQWVEASKEQCRYCWCLPTCSMGCLATIGNENGFSRDDKNKACLLHRRHMHRVIEDYCHILEENSAAFDYANDIEFF